MVSPLNSDQFRTLLESTQAIPWRLNWQTRRFEYIGPQIELLLGWPLDSWQTMDDWAARVHPDERDGVVAFCTSQTLAGNDHEIDYQILAKDGECVWIRDYVHVIHNDGEVEALVGFLFDISERKLLEQSLENANAELRRANQALQEAMKAIKAIGDIIPVCAWCGNKIRTDEGEWMNVDHYIRTHTDFDVTHGICPDCKDELLKGD